MERLPTLLHEVVLVIVLVLAVGSAAAQDQVTRLRMDKVSLYACEDPGRKIKDFGRNEFQAPWPIKPGGPSKEGLLAVEINGEPYCVRAYTVETNKPVHASGDCGTMVASAQPRSGATRGLGDKHCRDKAK